MEAGTSAIQEWIGFIKTDLSSVVIVALCLAIVVLWRELKSSQARNLEDRGAFIKSAGEFSANVEKLTHAIERLIENKRG